jgi:protein-L-isoaspartate O-methyltransferase
MSAAAVQQWTRVMEKQLGERLTAVMADPMMLKVYHEFGGEVFRRSSVFHGLAKLLEKADVRGGTCFEIGTWNGLTAAVLSRRFEQVVTVDIAHNPIKHRILEHLGIRNVRCIDIERNADKAGVLRGLKYDCAYLDGNHAEDTEDDFDLVRGCGRVIFHEVWPHQSPVWELVQGLPRHQVVHGGFCLALWDGSLKPRKAG